MKIEKINKIIESINSLIPEREYVSNEMVYRNVKKDGISREETREILEDFSKLGDLSKGQGNNRGLYKIKNGPLRKHSAYSEEFGRQERSFIVEEPIIRFS